MSRKLVSLSKQPATPTNVKLINRETKRLEGIEADKLVPYVQNKDTGNGGRAVARRLRQLQRDAK